MMIDAHQQFGELGRFETRWLHAPQHRKICRDYRPEHLKPLIDAAGVTKTIFVQTQHNVEEHRWTLDFAEPTHVWQRLAGLCAGGIVPAAVRCAARMFEFTQ